MEDWYKIFHKLWKVYTLVAVHIIVSEFVEAAAYRLHSLLILCSCKVWYSNRKFICTKKNSSLNTKENETPRVYLDRKICIKYLAFIQVSQSPSHINVCHSFQKAISDPRTDNLFCTDFFHMNSPNGNFTFIAFTTQYSSQKFKEKNTLYGCSVRSRNLTLGTSSVILHYDNHSNDNSYDHQSSNDPTSYCCYGATWVRQL